MYYSACRTQSWAEAINTIVFRSFQIRGFCLSFGSILPLLVVKNRLDVQVPGFPRRLVWHSLTATLHKQTREYLSSSVWWPVNNLKDRILKANTKTVTQRSWKCFLVQKQGKISYPMKLNHALGRFTFSKVILHALVSNLSRQICKY